MSKVELEVRVLRIKIDKLWHASTSRRGCQWHRHPNFLNFRTGNIKKFLVGDPITVVLSKSDPTFHQKGPANQLPIQEIAILDTFSNKNLFHVSLP